MRKRARNGEGTIRGGLLRGCGEGKAGFGNGYGRFERGS